MLVCNIHGKLIHSANPKSQSVGIIVFAHVVRPSVRTRVHTSVRPHFSNLEKQMFATGMTMGLAEWIIDDDTCLVNHYIRCQNKSTLSLRVHCNNIILMQVHFIWKWAWKHKYKCTQNRCHLWFPRPEPQPVALTIFTWWFFFSRFWKVGMEVLQTNRRTDIRPCHVVKNSDKKCYFYHCLLT